MSVPDDVPDVEDVRALMKLNDQDLTEADFKRHQRITQIIIDNTKDTLVHLYYICWKIALGAAWSHLTRIGDETYSNPDADIWKEEYEARCRELSIQAKGTNQARLQKINSAKDDFPVDLNDC